MLTTKNQEVRKIHAVRREEYRKAFRAGRRQRIAIKRAFLDAL